MKNQLKGAMKGGFMALATGDAMGNAVQFESRQAIRQAGPVTGMRPGGAFATEAGCWTDDTSLALATLFSLWEKLTVDPDDIMNNFVKWLLDDEFTSFGETFDVGRTCFEAIQAYIHSKDWKTCGRTGEYANGNGSLMRILPVCVWAVQQEEAGKLSERDAVVTVELVSSLTHNHKRAAIACGLYYFLCRELMTQQGELLPLLQAGLDKGFAFYAGDEEARNELLCYERVRNLGAFRSLPDEEILSGGYVVESFEAALWSLANTQTLPEALLKAVNLGHDADSVGAICGGLAGIYYGYEAIPEEWLSVVKKRDWLESLCEEI